VNGLRRVGLDDVKSIFFVSLWKSQTRTPAYPIGSVETGQSVVVLLGVYHMNLQLDPKDKQFWACAVSVLKNARMCV